MSEQFRILDRNYAFQEDCTITPSSEDPNFPASNLKKFLRSKVWRSAGSFQITTSNQKIDFKESGMGPQLTATIPVGFYTVSDLEDAIKAQMELVGAETYTASYSALTGRWTIASAGSYLDLLFSSGTNVASSLGPSIGYLVSDLTGSLTYTGAKVAIHTAERVVFDMGVTTGIDSVALLFDPMVDPKFSDSAVLKIEASATNSWGSPPVSQTLTVDTDWRAALHFFTSTQSYRYWAVTIIDPQNPNLYVELSKVILAFATQLSQVPQAGFGHNVSDQSKSQTTPYGHKYSDLYPMLHTQTFTYEFLPDADVQTLQKMYEVLGETVPIALALDPGEECFDKERFFIYGTMKGDFKMKHRFTTYFDVPLTVEEVM